MDTLPERAPARDDRLSVPRREALHAGTTGIATAATTTVVRDPGQHGVLGSRMRETDMAAELFYPLEHGQWDDRGRLIVDKREVREVRTRISGVRFQAADPTGEDLTLERQVQHDVTELIRSLRAIRQIEGHENVVLSRSSLRCRQPVRGLGTRVKFGLLRDPRGRHGKDPDAARLSHRSIRRAIRGSGLVVEQPQAPFDPKTGLAGLHAWASALKLRQRRTVWPWLLLLLLPLLLLGRCDSPTSFFGMPIETDSLIVLVDKSGSMGPSFPAVRAETRNVLTKLASGGTGHANVIVYDSSATSVLGGLAEIQEDTIERILSVLDQLTAGGGTNLASGLELAASEVAAHGRPTTLVILTDGADSSISAMLSDMGTLKERFKGIRVIGNTLTPRCFDPAADPSPTSEAERGLASLADSLEGRFGHKKEGS